jgi:CDP-6-deoxy-D-xylo-4-hexulose-3-dehydrase
MHPLMDNNITQSDINALIFFLKKNKKKIFTQSIQVSNFEKKWSNWLGIKYSVFVNSGSSANLLTLQIIKILYGTGEIIVPPLTWISDIASVIQNNFKPVFVDINLKNLCMDEDQIIKKINKKTKAIFITHAQGFNGLSNKLLRMIKDRKIILLEDVCESHGAMFNKKKLGTFGLISNFSFYYAHHLSTIEGGMICTNDKKVFEIAKMLRSHGMLRECGNKVFEKKMQKKYKYLSTKFIFF